MKNNLRWLLLGRILRSFSTAFLTVIFPLYLARAGYSATKIGFVLAISGGVTVLLVAGVGLAADAFGRKRVIMSLAGLAVLGGIGMAWSPVFWVVVLASGLGGVGRGGGAGSGGSWGPVFPAEQPLVADSVEPQQRTRAFGQLSFVGVLAGAAGSLVAAIPDILHSHGMSWIASYRWLFGASAL
ncbi:MAG: MFS transporter, partial [Sulfobacillus sp.]